MTQLEWLQLPDVFRCILVEIDYTEGGSTKTACFARGNFRSSGTDTPAYTPYRDFIVGGLSFSTAIDSVLFGQTKTRAGEVVLLWHSVTESLLTKAIPGNAIRIYIGDESWPKSDFYQIATLISDDVGISGQDIKITFKEFAEDMDAPVLTDKTTDSKLIPLCLGRVSNITPILIDELTSTYQFNREASQAVTAAKFNGDIVDPADYTVNLTNSTITFSVMPIGQITLDVDGSNTGSWKQSASDIISHIFPGAVIDPGLENYLLGIYINDETTLGEMLDDITSSIGAYWFFDESGVLNVQPFNDVTGTATAKLTDDQNQEDSRRVVLTLSPAKEIKMGYARNYTLLTSVAGNVYNVNAATAEYLQKEYLTVTKENAAVATDYKKSALINAVSAIVNKADTENEALKRKAISNKPRVIYQTKQMAAGFGILLGEEVELTTPGVNGSNAIITRKEYDLLNDTITLEFWQ